MEKFVVSARKYRPTTFDSVVGQSHITTTLKNAIKTEHLAQAFLFCGPRGVGKTTCARILAKTINCTNVTADIEPCHTCTSCKNFTENASFNIHELDAASNNSVEDIRNLIDQVRFPPQDGKYKVYIIDEVHMLSSAAFNAFLKTLEEPPSYAIFILATTEKHKILPTILSRCQIFDFNRIKIKDMADHLTAIAGKENIEVEAEAMELIAQKADGGLRDALSMFDLNVTFSEDSKITYAEVLENLHVLDHDYYFKIVDALYASDLSQSLLLFDEILSKGFDGHQFVSGLNSHIRNLLVGSDAATVKLMEVSESVKGRFLQQAKDVDTSFLLSALSLGSQIDLTFKTAKNQRLHVEIGLMKMAHIVNVLNLRDLPAQADEKKKPNEQLNAAPVASQSVVNQPVVNKEAEVVQTKPETAAVVPSSPTPKKKFSKLKSVADLEEEVLAPAAKAKLAQEEDRSQFKENVELNEVTLKTALMNFADTLQKQSEKVIAKSDFLLKGNEMELQIMNQTLMDVFLTLKQDLLDFIRKEVSNYDLQISAILTAKTKEAKPRTEEEKFRAMLEKNPALKDLKDHLGLDLVY
ncbi:DNA polymerase-3 subunit gamma/tau [Spirosomataceae bacterium TFI 002]|nr:DNA polymerase-3 subunit gamma/tau [Spirosomataceae bacterium TFI 002]